MSDYSLGLKLSDDYIGTLAHALTLHPKDTALEFGVASGTTLAMIASHMPVIGFDSFEGLPEKWRDGFEQGMFACSPPQVPNATLVAGWFEDTLPGFNWPDRVGLVHLDADLYSSTKTVLSYIGDLLKTDTLVCFDEWFGYPGCEDHEQKAWKEFVADNDIDWEVIGHGPEQWLIRIK